jgi:hypothetical protein
MAVETHFLTTSRVCRPFDYKSADEGGVKAGFKLHL